MNYNCDEFLYIENFLLYFGHRKFPIDNSNISNPFNLIIKKEES